MEQVLAPLYFKPHSPLLWLVVTNLNRFRCIDLLPKNCFPDRLVNVRNGHWMYTIRPLAMEYRKELILFVFLESWSGMAVYSIKGPLYIFTRGSEDCSSRTALMLWSGSLSFPSIGNYVFNILFISVIHRKICFEWIFQFEHEKSIT